MPTLKQVSCSIELGPRGTKLKEYGARYSDGGVETFVAVPETKIPFHIHLETKGYIAPGLAAFVFMDGQYQCNRNRLRLKLPEDGVDPSQYEIDFYMRQKEEKAADGRFVGREWTFAELNTTTADKAATLNPSYLQNLGTIEVVILRCKSEGRDVPTPNPSPRSQSKSQPKGSARQARTSTPVPSELGGLFGLFDGANDEPEHGHALEPIASYDGANDIPDNAPAQPPSGLEWDHVNGHYKQKDHGSVFGACGGHRDDRSAVARPDPNATGDDRNAQLDGMGGFINPQIFINGYPGGHRGVNDMSGDKALGLEGDARRQYKAWLRSCGEAVSESAFGQRQSAHHYQQPQAYGNVPQPQTYGHPQHPQLHTKPQQAPNPRITGPDQVEQVPDVVPGAQGDIYLDMNGDLVYGGDVVPAAYIDNLLNGLTKAAKQIKAEADILNARGVQLPGSHPDHIPLRQRLAELISVSEATLDRRARVRRALEAGRLLYKMVRPADPHNAAPVGDLTARLRAQQDAKYQGQGQVAQQGDVGNPGFKQVGEGVIGGGAPNDQGWQTLKDEQKLGGKPQSDAGWGTTGKKDDSLGGWGGSPQNDAGGWGATDQKDHSAGSWGGDQAANGWDVDKAKSQRTGSPYGGNDGGWGNDGNPQNDGGWGSPAKSAGRQSNKAQQHWGNETTPGDATLQLQPKPYWSAWQQNSTPHEAADPNTKKRREEPRQPYHYPAPQLPAVPSDKVNGASHGVQPGKGADYSHRCHRPNYMDEMAAPYAVFSFKYRSKAALEKIIRRDVAAETDAVVEQVEREMLLMMPRDRLVEQMLKLRSPGSGADVGSAKKLASQAGWGADNAGGWGSGDNNPRTPSHKGSSNKGGSAAGGWGGADNGDTGNSWGGGGNHWDSKPDKTAPSNDWNKENSNQADANGWGADNNAQQAGNGWDDSKPTGTYGWDGGNESKADAKVPADATGFTPKTRDFAYEKPRFQQKPEDWGMGPAATGPKKPYDWGYPQPAADPPVESPPAVAQPAVIQPALPNLPVYVQKATDPDVDYCHVSQATGFTRSTGRDHPFNGNEDFVKRDSGRGGGRGGRGSGRGGHHGAAAMERGEHGQIDGSASEKAPEVPLSTKPRRGGRGGGTYSAFGGRDAAMAYYANYGKEKGDVVEPAAKQQEPVLSEIPDRGDAFAAILEARLWGLSGNAKADAGGAGEVVEGQTEEVVRVDDPQGQFHPSVSGNMKMWDDGTVPEGVAGW
ncbi:hypothetical protein LTR53_000227 [Teratosphaeriaceae sp. CCFEE 6253]|nr:hypothetical protein LTR53_000227 [Teratosphaeriaceae sp. CCFEE 6253]